MNMCVEVYDRALRDPTGACIAEKNPALIKFNNAILALKKQGVAVERYDLRLCHDAYIENDLVRFMLQKRGIGILPVTLIRGRVIKMGEYPSYEEICKQLGIEPLKKPRPITLYIDC
jgi:hypothetical protein